MPDYLTFDVGERPDCLFVHFDVDGHFLKLDTFIKTAESARDIIAALDNTFFQGSLQYELIVLPPDEGSFLKKLVIWVTGGTAAVFGFLNSDVGAAYIEGLTGKAPVEWAKELGQANRDHILDASELLRTKEGTAAESTKLTSVHPIATKFRSDYVACQSSAKMIVALTRGILEKETSELSKIGLEAGGLIDALDARADFYAACINDREVKGVGFTPDDKFPVSRMLFPERAQKPVRKEKEEEPIEWVVSTENIYVTSPNWDENDQRARQWKGKDSTLHDCYFVIEDSEFWRLVKRKDLRVEVLDILKVQWAYQIVDGRPKNRRVLCVLEFNENKLADPLSSEEMQLILGRYAIQTVPHSQLSLFDK